MNDQEIEELMSRYVNGSATEEEAALIEHWYMNLAAKEEVPESNRNLSQVKAAIWHRIHRRRIVPIYRYAAAAMLLVAIGVGGYSYLQHKKANDAQVAVVQDIAPGKNTATLTLANGQKIILSNASTGQIAKQAGVHITKKAGGQVVYTIAGNDADPNQFNTLSTAKGETYKVNLPDGTQVWLNAASSLTYPARFTGTDRKVTLTGEGYFEVAKDKAHPFKVATGGQEVTVLGTHFNINAYTNESATKTTLLEGSVKVSADNNYQIIKPGQQAALRNGHIKIQEIDADQAVAWKDNNFVFDGEDIPYIMRMVERWYNVEVIYDGYNSSEKYYGGVSRFENVSEVLKSLESAKKIHFKIEGRKIFVRK